MRVFWFGDGVGAKVGRGRHLYFIQKGSRSALPIDPKPQNTNAGEETRYSLHTRIPKAQNYTASTSCNGT